MCIARRNTILSGPGDTRICFTFSNDNEELKWNSKTYSIYSDYLWNTAVYFDLFQFWELNSNKVGIGALTVGPTIYIYEVRYKVTNTLERIYPLILRGCSRLQIAMQDCGGHVEVRDTNWLQMSAHFFFTYKWPWCYTVATPWKCVNSNLLRLKRLTLWQSVTVVYIYRIFIRSLTFLSFYMNVRF